MKRHNLIGWSQDLMTKTCSWGNHDLRSWYKQFSYWYGWWIRVWMFLLPWLFGFFLSVNICNFFWWTDSKRKQTNGAAEKNSFSENTIDILFCFYWQMNVLLWVLCFVKHCSHLSQILEWKGFCIFFFFPKAKPILEFCLW